MKLPRTTFASLLLLLPGLALADPTAAETKLPLTGLAPAKLVPDLCLVRYRVTTTSPECQAFFDQGLGYQYSYVWMEAARSFEMATRHDPTCAMAWWGLSRALGEWRRGDANKAAQKANELKDHASYREQQLILARMQERGLVPGLTGIDARYQAAIRTLDNLLAVHDDDQEAWFYRGLLAAKGQLFGRELAAVPFYKSLLRVNPLHPGANHELVHFYENIQRPALGWVYAENYIQSSPGIPHPFHMQAHLATRIGRWDKTCDRSSRAIELERAYHKLQGVKATEDAQFNHHLEVLTLSLIHDGRFREARAIKDEVMGYGWRSQLTWFRLHLAEHDWAEALKIADQHHKFDKVTAAYLSALVYLKKGEPDRALPEVQVLQEAYQKRKNDRSLEFRLWETQGMLLCQTGDPEGGLKLLARTVERSKNDYSHHSWGNGAYYMETWGAAALKCGKSEVAEEAFLESLAHDPGSVRGALGLQILCQRQGRSEEAARYGALAHRSWRHAEVHSFDAERVAMEEMHLPQGAQRTQREVPRSTKRGEGAQ